MKPEADDYSDEDYDDPQQGPWCRDFEVHGQAKAHEFCIDHQASWCLLCDKHGCPQCVDDPHCPECHCALFSEYHEWDCSCADEED